ncbi:MAG: DUF438 domain-containing protein [Candidatus Kapaibacterium sp.]|jgi:DUF438 domain-containing protein|nr:DUF438 domain-containing protein [Candidatus Kapabacteria bacterium]
MSEFINNSEHKKEMLKQLFLKLHEGETREEVRQSLISILGSVPYSLVVEAEQELIKEGLPASEIQKFCDLHSQVLEGRIDLNLAKIIPPGHPIDTFKHENKALINLSNEIDKQIESLRKSDKISVVELMELKSKYNLLGDIDKHYKRKEYLVFPFLEKKGITGPPTVMWGKHDEIREKLKNAQNSLDINEDIDSESFGVIADMFLTPVTLAVKDMVYKENEILFPMCGDMILEAEWFEIYNQTSDYGYCIVEPKAEWKPKLDNIQNKPETKTEGFISMPTGNLKLEELTSILNTLPFDLTFVDKDDKVKYFSHGKERIFDRSKAILMRDVRMCHPPHSVHIVDRIIEDFRSGKESRAPFWINFKGRFIHIEYFAVRDESGNYLGTLELTQDLTELRSLSGEQRLLSYASGDDVS